METIQRHRFVLEAIAIIVITGLIGVMIAFFGESYTRYQRAVAPPESSAAVVINEVYPALLSDDPGPHQWIELYNRTQEWQMLDGWALETAAGGRLPLPHVALPPHGYLVVAASVEQFMADHPTYIGEVVAPTTPWPGLDQQADYIVLRDLQGQPVDAVNWGTLPPNAPEDAGLWSEPKFSGGTPWLKETSFSFERWPVGVDRDVSTDLIYQPYPSPGTVNVPSATRAANNLFIQWTNVASYAGGLLLWIAFVYIALIARRFETLTQQRTFWQAMLVAPSGIMVYNIIQAWGFLQRGRMNDTEKWWGFSILFVSALICTGLVYLFRDRAKRILEG